MPSQSPVRTGSYDTLLILLSLLEPVLTGDINLVVKMDVDAAIASAFFLDLADSHLTDFAR